MIMKKRHITKLAFILTITTLIVGLSSCDRVQQVVDPGYFSDRCPDGRTRSRLGR